MHLFVIWSVELNARKESKTRDPQIKGIDAHGDENGPRGRTPTPHACHMVTNLLNAVGMKG